MDLPSDPFGLLHTWVEVLLDGPWIALEGLILDASYLSGVRNQIGESRGFCGYAVATCSLSSPPVEWAGTDTFIQREAITEDLGLYDDPDALYAEHGANLVGFKRWLFAHIVRHRMNLAEKQEMLLHMIGDTDWRPVHAQKKPGSGRRPLRTRCAGAPARRT